MPLRQMAPLSVDPRFCANRDGDIETASNFHAEESGRRHSDNVHRMPIQRDLFSDGRRATAELALREPVAGDGNWRSAARTVVIGRDQPAGGGLDPERLEIVAGNPKTGRQANFASVG